MKLVLMDFVWSDVLNPFNTLSGSYRDEAWCRGRGWNRATRTFNTLSGSYRDEALVSTRLYCGQRIAFQYPQRVVPG